MTKVPDDEGRSAYVKVTYDAWNRPTSLDFSSKVS